MGRYPHFDNAPSVFDRQIIEYALEKVGMIDKATQNYPTLSGGEKQKVQMARVLAQIGHQNPEDKTPKYLFLDEPTTSLDIRFQLQILDLTKELLNQNVTIIAILHDLNLSFQYGNNFFFLQHGQLIHQTADKQTISESLIESIYEVKARKQIDKESKEETWRFRLS